MFAIGLLAAAAAHAQVADPTAPPPGLAALTALGGGDSAPAAPTGPELQSVLVSREPGGRRIAVISGEMVRQGGRYEGAVVERVDEGAVVLRRGKVREVLKLQPRPVVEESRAAAGRSAGTPAAGTPVANPAANPPRLQ